MDSSPRITLKKKWEAFRYHVASRWVFFGYRGDQQAGSSQTPTIGFVTYRFCVLCVHQALLPCPLGMPKSGCCQAYLPWLLGEGAYPWIPLATERTDMRNNTILGSRWEPCGSIFWTLDTSFISWITFTLPLGSTKHHCLVLGYVTLLDHFMYRAPVL